MHVPSSMQLNEKLFISQQTYGCVVIAMLLHLLSLISKIEMQTSAVTDANFRHRFEDGKCSCSGLFMMINPFIILK